VLLLFLRTFCLVPMTTESFWWIDENKFQTNVASPYATPVQTKKSATKPQREQSNAFETLCCQRSERSWFGLRPVEVRHGLSRCIFQGR
jgi:hypothetical protein